MTLQQYEIKLEEVKKAFPKQPQWVKDWTVKRMQEMVKEIK